MIWTIEALGAAIAGLFMLFGTRIWIERAQHAHQRRIDDRIARGSDAYFEELRSLKAYNPMRKVWTVRLVGLLLLLFAALYFLTYRVS